MSKTGERRRVLGIDYGTRRWGLAFGDELGVAVPLAALTDADERRRREGLAAVCRERRVTEFVVGLPLNMDGSAGFKAKEAEAFAEGLRREFGLPAHLVDERLTSHEAEAGMTRKELRATRARGVVDSRAAALILQDWLDQWVCRAEAGGEEALS
ncbi:MAG: Holliday junction resolvase RuvX [Opitutaceae bacterium]|jgi:putative Holliday junction resolvase|nr:Holliday junction resolvase RuvX [Opitutaceae bacterium]